MLLLPLRRLLRERLRQRGRESEGEIADRIARAQAYSISGDDVVELRNDGDRESGIARLVAAIVG